MSKTEIRDILGIKSLKKEFKRYSSSEEITDSFSEFGLFVNYDNENKCSSFELHTCAQVIFNDVELLNLTFLEFFGFFKTLDENITEDESGCNSTLFGIGCYAPHKIEFPNEKIESIIVYKKGYYE